MRNGNDFVFCLNGFLWIEDSQGGTRSLDYTMSSLLIHWSQGGLAWVGAPIALGLAKLL